MVYNQDDIIWGVGKSRRIAQSDARKNLKENPFEDVVFGRAVPCSKFMYEKVCKHGSTENDTWHIENGIAVLDSETYEKVKKSVFSSIEFASDKDFYYLKLEDQVFVLFKGMQDMLKLLKSQRTSIH